MPGQLFMDSVNWLVFVFISILKVSWDKSAVSFCRQVAACTSYMFSSFLVKNHKIANNSTMT